MPRIPATTILLLRFRPNCRARNRAPAGAVTIPAAARGAFHLPPAAEKNTREGYYDNPNRSLNGIMASK